MERGKQDQVLIDRRLGEREKEIVLKLWRKENSLSLAQNQTPLLDKPAIHFATTLTEPVSTHYIKESRTFKNSFFKDYKILKTITQSFLSCGSLVQITNRK